MGELNVKRTEISHETLSLRTQELGKGLRNLTTAKKDRAGEKLPVTPFSASLLPSGKWTPSAADSEVPQSWKGTQLSQTEGEVPNIHPFSVL